jgi:hypothetical protein
MHHCLDGMATEYACQGLRIAHIAFMECNPPAGNPFYPVNHFSPAVAQVVYDHNIVASLEQLDTGMGTNVTSPARHQKPS